MSTVKVKIFGLLRLALGISELDILLNSPCTLKNFFSILIKELDEEKGRLLSEKLFEENKLKQGVIVLKNGENVLHLSGLETEVKPGDVLSIFPPGGGG